MRARSSECGWRPLACFSLAGIATGSLRTTVAFRRRHDGPERPRRGIEPLCSGARISAPHDLMCAPVLRDPLRCSVRRGAGSAEAHRRRPVPLDLMLPDMAGTQVCLQLRADPATRAVPIVMMTAKAAEIDRVVGFELRVDRGLCLGHDEDLPAMPVGVGGPELVRDAALADDLLQEVFMRVHVHLARLRAPERHERPTRACQRPTILATRGTTAPSAASRRSASHKRDRRTGPGRLDPSLRLGRVARFL